MGYTNSTLISKTKLSPNRYNGRSSILGVVPHCYVGYASMDDCASWFGKSSSNASCNYYIDPQGNIIMIVEEKNAAWTTSSYQCDMNHVTIECASAKTSPYGMTDATYQSLVKLTADIYKRNGIKECKWSASRSHDGEPGYLPMHRNYKNKACPGDWLVERYKNGDFCKRVNAILKGEGEKKDMTESNPRQYPGKATNDNGIKYQAHVQSIGWCAEVHDGQMAGTTGFGKRLEALKISLPEGVKANVKAHIQGIGWKTYKNITKDTVIGTTGQGKRLEAIEIEATGLPEGKKLMYQVHVQTFGWMDWTENGYPTGTMNQSKRLEAFRLKLV